jgi:hypothetical protein
MPFDPPLGRGGAHAHCSRSFGMRRRLKAAQLNTNTQATLADPRSFTFFSGPICLSHPNGFSTNQRLLRLISYPGWCVVRPSIALRRFAVFWDT